MKKEMAILGRLVGIALVIGTMVTGCDASPQVEHPAGDEAWDLAHSFEAADEEVVARINGRVITVEDVRVEWKSTPDATADQVLERLVEREVVAQQAQQAGYHRGQEIPFVRKQGLITAMLEEEVESADVDESRRERLYQQVTAARRAPEGLRASHLVILVPTEIEEDDGTVTRLRRDDREPYFEEARRFVESALDALDGRSDDDALREVAQYLEAEVIDEPFQAVVNEHLRFPRPGQYYEADHLPRGWVSVVDEFSEGAEAMAGQDRFGQLSQPVRTNFGWHLIRVDEVLLERPVDEESAHRFVEGELLRQARQQRYAEFVEGLIDGVEAEIYPERLGSVFEE